MSRGDAELSRARFFVDPERCFSGCKPCFGMTELRAGARVPFPRCSGSKGVIVGSRCMVLFINSKVKEYSHLDSSATALATSLRRIASGQACMPLLYAKPAGGDTYAQQVHRVFSELQQQRGVFERAQNIWVLLYAPNANGAQPYVVMGRFRFENYIGGCLCLVPQDSLIADMEVYVRVRNKKQTQLVVAPSRAIVVADDLMDQAYAIEQHNNKRKRE